MSVVRVHVCCFIKKFAFGEKKILRIFCSNTMQEFDFGVNLLKHTMRLYFKKASLSYVVTRCTFASERSVNCLMSFIFLSFLQQSLQ